MMLFFFTCSRRWKLRTKKAQQNGDKNCLHLDQGNHPETKIIFKLSFLSKARRMVLPPSVYVRFLFLENIVALTGDVLKYQYSHDFEFNLI